MFGKITTRGLALVLVSLPLVIGGPTVVFAQYQLSPLGAETTLNQAAVVPEPFGLDTLPVTEGEILSKWSGVVAEIRADGEVLAHCREAAQSCPVAARKFLAVIADGRERQGRARFGIVNRAINLAIEPMSDFAQWGVADRWSAPLETFGTGRGDCEDYAIAKYVALKEAGVAEDDLRLVIVRDLALGQDHAVVAARLDDKWIVLDNRRLVLLQDVEMPRVLPLFVLGRDGVKQFAEPIVAQTRNAPAPSALRAQISPL